MLECSICGRIIDDEVEYGGEGISPGEIYCIDCYNMDDYIYDRSEAFTCCKCSNEKSFDQIAIKHYTGGFECIDCYAKSMDAE